MKKIVTLTMAVIMLISLFTFSVSAQENVLVYIDGERIEFDVQPQIINGRTLVPMRKIFEELGAAVDWDNSTQTAIGTKNNTSVKITINDNNIYKNGVASTLDVPAQLIDGRTLVPVRAISEAFGVDVFWRGEINTVSIRSSENIEYIKMYDTDFEPVDVEKVLKQLYLEKGWTDNIVNESLNSGLTLLKEENLVYSNFNNVHSIDNILPGLKCYTHNEISYPEFDIYSYYYAYDAKTIEDAEKYAMKYARFLEGKGYELICEMDDPMIIDDRDTNIVYELVTPDKEYLVQITSEINSWDEHPNEVKVSIESFKGESTRAKYDGFYSPSASVVMYAPDGRTITIKGSEVSKYKSEGWYTEPVQTLYAVGKSAVFKKSEVEAQLTVGWYTEPVQTLYAPGKSAVFKQSEVEAQLAVGWYEYPVIQVYANDGRTMVINENELSAYENVGWSKTNPKYRPLGRKITASDIDVELIGTNFVISNKSEYTLEIDRLYVDNKYHDIIGTGKAIIKPYEVKAVYCECDHGYSAHDTSSEAYIWVKQTVPRADGAEYWYVFKVSFTINGIYKFECLVD